MKYHAIVTNAVEIIAAFSGFYYLSKNRNSKIRYFVYFLVFTILVEALGSYTHLYDKIEILSTLKGTRFEQNYWLFNIFIVVSLIFYILFYRLVLTRHFHKKVLLYLLFTSLLVIPILTFIQREEFFSNNLSYNFIWTSLSVFICVCLYFYELLMSNKVLKFYKSTLFYISIGLFLWWLVFPPVVFYFPFYNEDNKEMISMKGIILITTNIYLYSCLTIGFLWGKHQQNKKF